MRRNALGDTGTEKQPFKKESVESTLKSRESICLSGLRPEDGSTKEELDKALAPSLLLESLGTTGNPTSWEPRDLVG